MRRLVFLLFFLSGACGLVYEIVWSRVMTHVFGSTAIAVGTVLAAFMSGLAAGSWLLGRAADRSRNTVLLYAYLEIGVGLAALGAHFLLVRIAPVYIAVYEMFGRSDAMLGLVRFILAFSLVMAPTMLMGATLPVLARFFVTSLAAAGKGLSTVYAINTVGALTGSLVTGFYLIGAYGLDGTVYLAALGNITIGVIAWIASSRTTGAAAASQAEERPAFESHDREVLGTGTYRLLLLGLAISGFTSFAYEIYWVRSLVFLLGNSTYAVTTMLTAFLAGIALGGYLVRFIVDRVGDGVVLFGWIQVLIGISSSSVLPVLFAFAGPQTIREYLGEASSQAGLLIVARFAVALLVMIVPATIIGMTFPLVGRIGILDHRRTGSIVGRVYALNTLGNVAGALLPGLVLLHWLGIQRGILVMAALNTSVGLAVLLSRIRRVRSLSWALPAAFAASVVVLALVPLDFQLPSESQPSWQRVLFYREGPSATVTVRIDPESREKSMSVDGVVIGGTGFTEFKQQLLAHLPKLLLDDVSAELSIGLGSGILVGESARHERVESITCVEIEPSVVAGASFFADENHGALQDPRIRIVQDDVANHLRTTSEMYRVISADEKTAQEYASNGFSYSREYYGLLRARLAPGGMVFQWVPTTLPPNQYAMVLKTFTGVFRHASLWLFPSALQRSTFNTILVGSNERIEFDHGRIRHRLTSDPEAFRGIARYGLTSAEAMLAHFVADGETIRNTIRIAPENTLDRPRYEFFSPRDYEAPRNQRLATNYDLLVGMRRAAWPAFASKVVSADDSRLNETLAAERAYTDAYRRSRSGTASDEEVFRRFNSVLLLAPWNDSLRARISLDFSEISAKYSSRGDFRMAANLTRRALTVFGESAMTRVNMSLLLSRPDRLEEAIEEARIAVDLDPDLVAARRVLARYLLRKGRRGEAAEQLRALLEIEPDDATSLHLLSTL
jgi:spermidine synthase